MSNSPNLSMQKGAVYPSWYRLRFIDETCTIVFAIPCSVLNWFTEIKSSNFGSAQYYEKTFGLSFRDYTHNPWGYDKTIVTKKSLIPNWIEYHISIPKKIQEQDFPIASEKGERKLKCVAASIAQLVLVLNGIDEKYITKNDVPQFLTFQSFLSNERGLANFQIGAYYSRFIALFAAEQPKDLFNEIAYAIDKANGRMFPTQDRYREDVQSEIQVFGDFYLSMLSSHRVGMISYGHTWKDTDFDNGYGVSMCNPDTVTGQILSVVSLCKLYEVVERYFKINGIMDWSP